jgi:hypothetical protein
MGEVWAGKAVAIGSRRGGGKRGWAQDGLVDRSSQHDSKDFELALAEVAAFGLRDLLVARTGE